MYSDIIIKIRELKQCSSLPASGFICTKTKMDTQESIINELRELALKHNTIVGRMLKFPFADSYSHYLVTRVDNGIATVQWIDYCDGWQDDRLGTEGTLPQSYVEEKVRGEDILQKIFS